MAVIEDIVRGVQLFRRLWISFKEHRLEGLAVSVGLASCPGLDWLREIVSVWEEIESSSISKGAEWKPGENEVQYWFSYWFMVCSL